MVWSHTCEMDGIKKRLSASSIAVLQHQIVVLHTGWLHLFFFSCIQKNQKKSEVCLSSPIVKEMDVVPSTTIFKEVKKGGRMKRNIKKIKRIIAASYTYVCVSVQKKHALVYPSFLSLFWLGPCVYTTETQQNNTTEAQKEEEKKKLVKRNW